jgi:peptidoglycan-associated lipoprotein
MVMIVSLRLGVGAVLVSAMVAGACGGKKPPPPTPQPAPAEKPATTPPAPPSPAPPPPAAPAPDRPLTEDEIFAKKTAQQLTEEKWLQPVYFELDSIALSEAARGILQKNVESMKKRTAVKVLVEGHADSRGTNEYNLALAERRADAVRDYLVSLGIANDRVAIVSKGEEQPFCKEETESCWEQNRVGFFIVTAK